jgi:hypothetical protein
LIIWSLAGVAVVAEVLQVAVVQVDLEQEQATQ